LKHHSVKLQRRLGNTTVFPGQLSDRWLNFFDPHGGFSHRRMNPLFHAVEVHVNTVQHSRTQGDTACSCLVSVSYLLEQMYHLKDVEC
jgi:hypothetical protein